VLCAGKEEFTLVHSGAHIKAARFLQHVQFPQLLLVAHRRPSARNSPLIALPSLEHRTQYPHGGLSLGAFRHRAKTKSTASAIAVCIYSHARLSLNNMRTALCLCGFVIGCISYVAYASCKHVHQRRTDDD
jgi:hypothetical protein